jgi:hypothetical protein
MDLVRWTFFAFVFAHHGVVGELDVRSRGSIPEMRIVGRLTASRTNCVIPNATGLGDDPARSLALITQVYEDRDGHPVTNRRFLPRFMFCLVFVPSLYSQLTIASAFPAPDFPDFQPLSI